MKRLRTCTECGETKDTVEFSAVNGKRTNVCKVCDEKISNEFSDTMENVTANMEGYTFPKDNEGDADEQ